MTKLKSGQEKMEEKRTNMSQVPNICEIILSPLNIPFIFTAIDEAFCK
jgi:hypothetical protein